LIQELFHHNYSLNLLFLLYFDYFSKYFLLIYNNNNLMLDIYFLFYKMLLLLYHLLLFCLLLYDMFFLDMLDIKYNLCLFLIILFLEINLFFVLKIPFLNYISHNHLYYWMLMLFLKLIYISLQIEKMIMSLLDLLYLLMFHIYNFFSIGNDMFKKRKSEV